MELKNPIPDSRTQWTVEPTDSALLGAEVLRHGVRFGVYSRHARRILIALFREGDVDPVQVLPLPSCHGHVFQGFIPGLKPGWLYGFHAEGPFDPKQGQRFNPKKFLIDPYARALHGKFLNPEGVLAGYAPDVEDADLFLDHRPSHPFMPKCVITESRFDWQDVRPPELTRDRLVIYEMHVRGFTAHESSKVAFPGTFLGVIEKIPHLKSLGINAVELLPVHAKHSEELLTRRGLSNYWGYNTAAFFALDPVFGSGKYPGCEIDEFKLMVRELHRAGIEVLLDVVYNHSAEGNELGPTLSLRGLDNRSHYSLTGSEEAPFRHYRNHTGCGNTLDFGNPAVVKLTLDSLRYFVEEFHVDGFRFDLATVLGREGGGAFDPAASFFTAAAQDPALRKTKLISEPWDLDTYALGRFPDGWMEWNGAFRDVTRRWVRGDSHALGELRERLEGSPDLYEPRGREPWSTVNFVTCHDGFTLRDLVSYEHKHNEANGEDNWDGTNENLSSNGGHEGEGATVEVEALRDRQIRNAILLAVLARGTPMLLGGDEFRRTQGGNNNAYCQDTPVSWYDWSHVEAQSKFVRFFQQVLAWRNKIGISNTWESVSNRGWGRCWQGWDAAGRPWPEDSVPHTRHAAFLLREPTEGPFQNRVEPGENSLQAYLLLNSEGEEKVFNLPALPPSWHWIRVVDTALASPQDIEPAGKGFSLPVGDRYPVVSHSSVLLLLSKF